MNTRHLKVNGTPLKRGIQIGNALNSQIRGLHQLRPVNYGPIDLSMLIKNLEIHTPICLEELIGMAQSLSMKLGELIQLNFEYEVWMEQNKITNKCTAFVSTNPITLGQTNDEDPSLWFEGKEDLVLEIAEENNNILLYTHPGIPAYMGMNKSGICILWQYIDTGERNFVTGVPTTAIIREVLSKQSLEEAFDFLHNTPKCIPNNFILADQTSAINIECTSTRFVSKIVDRDTFCHANHILLDQNMKNADIGVIRPESTTIQRQKKIEELIRPSLSVDETKKILETVPIKNENTLASIIFVPGKLEMHIKFADDQDFRIFSL